MDNLLVPTAVTFGDTDHKQRIQQKKVDLTCDNLRASVFRGDSLDSLQCLSKRIPLTASHVLTDLCCEKDLVTT